MFKIKTLLTIVSLLPNLVKIFNENDISAQNRDFILSVNPFGNEEKSFDTINWFEKDGQFSLFLPSDIDRSSLKIYFDSFDTIEINGTTLHSGDTTDVFATNDSYSVIAGSNSYDLKVFESANVASMFLETTKPLEYLYEDKSNKCGAKIRTFEDGEMTLDSELKHIKGRGNSTWKRPKKPYNIKFDKKTSLLGMDKAKKWTMLAAYFDPAFNKDPIGFELAKYFDQDFISDYRFVDVYINNDYQGAYIVCESVEIGENRVDITDLTKTTEKANDDADIESFPIERGKPFNTVKEAQWVNIPKDPDDITGGYLLEAEFEGRANDETSYFETTKGQYFTIKEPEYASKKQVAYISNYLQEMEDAIVSPTLYNSLGKRYTDYIDIDSFANFYILTELAENVDGGLTSTFFYKDAGGKLFAGPLWDNDAGFGNFGLAEGITTIDPSKWLINQNFYYSRKDDVIPEFPSIYTRLFRIKEFREKVSENWTKIRKNLTEKVINDIVDSITKVNKQSVLMNAYRWYDIEEETKIDFLIDLPRQFLLNRIKYFDIGFSKYAAYLFYDANGGRGYCVDNNIMVKGQIAFVNGPYHTYLLQPNSFDPSNPYGLITTPIKPPSDDMVFVGWNTKRDGSGKMYLPGAPIYMYGTITLYAQWKPSTGKEPNYNKPTLFDNPIIEFLESVMSAIELLLN